MEPRVKIAILFKIIVLLTVVLIIVEYNSIVAQKKYNKHRCMLYEMELVGLDSFWMKITGYDSIQITERHRNFEDMDEVTLEVNFCYPNKWQFEKWNKYVPPIHDTIFIHDRAKTVIIDQR